MKNLSQLVFLCLVSLMMFSSCSKENDQFVIQKSDILIAKKSTVNTVEPYEYQGYVISKKDGQAISNATVEVYQVSGNHVGSKKAITDTEGKFALKLTDDKNTVTVRVSANGFYEEVINLGEVNEASILLTSKIKVLSDIKNEVDEID